MTDLEVARIQWKARIRPAIEGAVEQANRKSKLTKIELSIADDPGQVISISDDRRIKLPGAEVTAYRFEAKTRVSRLAGASENESRQQRKLEARLHFDVDRDGRMKMTPFNCSVKKIKPIPLGQVTEEAIERAITELVDCLTSR